MADDDPIDDPIPDGTDETEAELRPDDPSEGLEPDAPTVSDPSEDLGPEIPEVADFDEADADPELQRQFWTLVVLFNVALFGASLGLMLVGFEGRWRVGGAMFATGALAFARGWRKYRAVTSDLGGESVPADD
ncbi:DUF7322 domain-containing protein [Halorussus halobius]|uniref:DUF7322 domain-containing protein n=1 Tax=Halorussus halobius TaxID=1710537 RepID=UPI001FCE827B|nr:hypothetical protein [Halorussus halobius]